MKKPVLFASLFFCLVFFPVSVFAGGKCEVTIVNKTGAQITKIIAVEVESEEAPETFNKYIPEGGSIVIELKRDIWYGIILVDEKERQYTKKEKQRWDEKEASIEFSPEDFAPKNVWQKLGQMVRWPWF